MEKKKESEMIVDEFTLKKIPMFDYPNCGYADVKDLYFKSFNQYLAEECTVREAVNGHYYHGIDYLMDENGMDKFVAMISGMLFMMEHNDVEADQAYGTNLDIRDFETGNYDYLFTEEDLVLIKADVKKIKDYLVNHPELLVD